MLTGKIFRAGFLSGKREGGYTGMNILLPVEQDETGKGPGISRRTSSPLLPGIPVVITGMIKKINEIF